MKCLLLLTSLILGAFSLFTAPAWSFTVATTPSSFSVTQGMATSIPVLYRGAETGTGLPTDVIYTSPSGRFELASGEVIGTNPGPLVLQLRNGVGSVAESLIIPVAVVERALQRGANRFIYTRTFGDLTVGLTATASIAFQITGEAAAGFTLKRVELYFDRERRSIETSVDQHTKGFKAYAELRFVGSGNLRGYWEVDGRILGTVNRVLTIGPTVVLESPETPPLPTFEAGTHLLRFVVVSPAFRLELPTIVYTVVPAKTETLLEQVLTVAPESGAQLAYLPPTVSWNRLAKPHLYEVVFLDAPEGDQVFNAYAKEPFYTLPIIPFNEAFQPGKSYWWRVKVLNDEGELLGESPLSMFRFNDN
jgi:hypothetical protein